MSETNATIQEEIDLIVKAARGERFHFIVVAYDHLNLVDRVKQVLIEKYPEREISALKVGATPNAEFIQNLLGVPSGLVFIDDFELLLKNDALALGFNQKRDSITKLAIALVCFVPLDRTLLRECPRKIPDMWSVRSLLAELRVYFPGKTLEFISGQLNNSYLNYSLSEKENEIDALEKRIQIIGQSIDSEGLLGQLYQNLGELYYSMGLFDKAIEINKKALALYQNINDSKGKVDSMNNIGASYLNQGNFDIALHFLENSLNIAKHIGDLSGQGIALNNIGQVYHSKGYYDEALKHMEKSLTIQIQVNDIQGVGTSLNNISQVYLVKGELDKALDYLDQSLALRRNSKDLAGEAATLNNISQAYSTRGEYSIAIKYLERSLEISRQIGDYYGESTALNNLAVITYSRGDLDAAINLGKQSLVIRQKIGDQTGEATSLNNLATAYILKKDYNSAIQLFNQSLLIRKRIKDTHGISVSLHNIATIYWEQYNNYDEFYTLEKQAYNLAKEIGDINGIHQIGKYFGRILCELGHIEEGIPVLRAAYDIAVEAGFSDAGKIIALIQKYSR